MGYWGVKSYENDEAADALDIGFDRVYGPLYEELMDDRNALTFEQVQQKLADSRTLEAAIAALQESLGADSEPDSWDDVGRLALIGIVVRHAELGVVIREPWLRQSIDWLQREEIDWDEVSARRIRRAKEIALLRGLPGADATLD